MSALPAAVTHLRCDNPGPMTLSGTNTYVVALGDGPNRAVVVIDPGPSLAQHHGPHLDAILRAVNERGGDVAVIVVTHHHDDHQGGVADLLAALKGSGWAVRVVGGGHGPIPSNVAGLDVVAAPGHTRDSVALLLRAGQVTDGLPVLFSGDTLLGGSSSYVAHPDGNLTDYLATLDRLAALVERTGPTLLAPGHGETGLDASAVIAEYRTHRYERLEQVRQVLTVVGPTTGVDDVVNAVYAGLEPELRPAVEAIVQAQLKHLRR